MNLFRIILAHRNQYREKRLKYIHIKPFWAVSIKYGGGYKNVFGGVIRKKKNGDPRKIVKWAFSIFCPYPPYSMDGVGACFFFILHYGRLWIFIKNCNSIHTLHWIQYLKRVWMVLDGDLGLRIENGMAQCMGGGASTIFSSPPPEDFKWNSPKVLCNSLYLK